MKFSPLLFALCLPLLGSVVHAQSNPTRDMMDHALRVPQINTDPGPEYADRQRSMNMSIGMDRTPQGRIWAAWVSGGDSELAYFVAATSDDDGATWSEPRLVIDPTEHESGMLRRTLVGNFWTDPTGKLWLFFDQAMGYYDGRAGVWAITCENPDAENPTWTEPRRIWHGATLNKPIVLKNGEWMMPISLWQRNHIHPKMERHFPTMDAKAIPDDYRDQFHELDGLRDAHVFVSQDQGLTWRRRGSVHFPHHNFDEHMMVELNDGRLWMLARTTNGNWESYSSDGGRTWTEPAKRFPHTSARFFLRRLSSGKLLLVRHGMMDETTKQRSHLRAFLSNDDGETWSGGLLIDERAGISYPDGFESPDGMIHILYDRNRYSDAEILMAKFREEDIAAGKFQSPGSKQRILINRATGSKP